MGAEKIYVASGHAAQQRCAEVVLRAQHGDPLAPVYIVVPNPAAGLQLRRTFPCSIANVHTVALQHVAQLVVATCDAHPETADQAPVVRAAVNWAFVHKAMADRPSMFEGLATHPATVDAVALTLRDMADADDHALDRLGALSARARELVTIERARRAALVRTGHVDRNHIVRRAAQVVRATPGALKQLGSIVVYMPTTRGEAEREFLVALHDTHTVHAIVDDHSSASLPSRAGDATPISDEPGLEGPTTHILNAPDAASEVRAIARDIIRRAGSGMALHDCAIIVHLAEPYQRLITRTLQRAGISVSGQGTRTLRESTTGRVAAELFHLMEHDLPREQLLALLACGPIHNPVSGEPISRTRVDTISRQAGIVRGAEQWADRLTTFAAALATSKANRPDELSTSIDQINALRDFVAYLAQHLAIHPESWTAMSEHVAHLLNALLGEESARRDWPAHEAAAHRRVLAAIHDLAHNDVADLRCTPALFYRALQQSLHSVIERSGRFGDGVFIGTPDDIVGCAFSTVYVVGMAEGQYPPRGTEDSLLTDSDRAACLPDAPRHDQRRATERALHMQVMNAARHRVLSFPRGDARAQRTHLPAPSLVAEASLLAGRPIAAAELLEVHAPWMTTITSYAETVAKEQPLDDADVITAIALRDTNTLPSLAPSVARAHDCIAKRNSNVFTEYDGMVDSLAGLLPERPLAPTALETWSACGFRYFVRDVLRVRPLDRPEDIDSLTAADRGTLLHDILDEFITRATPRTDPAEPWHAHDRALLHEIAETHFRRAVARGVTGRPLLWMLERRSMRTMLDHFCNADEAMRSAQGVVPFRTELAFGFDTDEAEHQPVRLTLPSGRVALFRGRIDRIDRSPDHSKMFVTDYKTGRPETASKDADPIVAGTRLQLPIYGLAAQRLAQASDITASYWYLRDATVPDSWGTASFNDVVARLIEGLDIMLGGIEAGRFPAVPGDASWSPVTADDVHENCRYCPYDQVCAVDRGELFARKQLDDGYASHRALVMEPTDD